MQDKTVSQISYMTAYLVLYHVDLTWLYCSPSSINSESAQGLMCWHLQEQIKLTV